MKISIIIPVYNVQKYLPECLDSLLEQTYTEWEALLVDDGSTDESGAICEKYALRDSRFRVIHKNNGGAASAKNVGLDHVKGEYVGFIDSDDYVERTWLESVMKIITDKGPDIVEFNFDKVFRTESKKENSYSDNKEEYTAEQYLAQYLDNWTSSLFWNKIVLATLVKKNRFRKERRCIDDEFFTYKVVSGAHKIVRINDVLYHYRQRASSAVQNTKNQQQKTDDALEVLIERYKWICEKFPNLRGIYLYHDVSIMFYFADFNHTEQTVKKFRNIARYYLYQVIFHKHHASLLKNVIRLQFISKKKLLEEYKRKEEDTSLYFE